MDRRSFVKSVAAAGIATSLSPVILAGTRRAQNSYLKLHPFIENNPDAVFIKRTNVLEKTDTSQKKLEGLNFCKELFTASDSDGIPFTHMLGIKPNLTCTFGTGDTVDGMGIRTDTAFMDGFLQGLVDLGYPGGNIAMREGNWAGDAYCPDDRLVGGIKSVAEKLGAHLLDFPSGRMIDQLSFETLIEEQEVTWLDVPNGVVLKRIGYMHPYNKQNSALINIAKFKAHGMGLTLCVKNLQGCIVSPLVRFCEGVEETRRHPAHVQAYFHDNMEDELQKSYLRHRNDGVPRWDRPGSGASGGWGMEAWANRTCDSHSVMIPGLHIIEGIYGRNGDGFNAGPGPNGKPEEFMSNYLIFGKNAFLVDIVGLWLGGHEPGNFGLFHIAKERGLIPFFNPRSVQLYSWDTGVATLKPLEDFQRFPLKTKYLTRDYNGQNEEPYHLVDEPFSYPVSVESGDVTPQTYLLQQNYANPFHSSTIIEYSLPRESNVFIEVFDSNGRRVDVLVKGWKHRGTHMTRWNVGRRAAGDYFYRFSANGFVQTRRMTVVR